MVCGVKLRDRMSNMELTSMVGLSEYIVTSIRTKEVEIVVVWTHVERE